jgi:hypothetical protein
MSATERTQAQVIQSLRRLQMRQLPGELESLEANCDLCSTSMPEDHRHLLHLDERRIVCVCESCWALRSGDAEYRPTGSRVVWLEDLDLPEDLWARFRVPIGLAFFLRGEDGVVAFYPSPVGATEAEIDAEAWAELLERNAVLGTFEADSEALIVDRTADDMRCVIAPTDEAYRLVGLVKISWEGISGGAGVSQAVDRFFEELRGRAA